MDPMGINCLFLFHFQVKGHSIRQQAAPVRSQGQMESLADGSFVGKSQKIID
jgi:hypothetical protein